MRAYANACGCACAQVHTRAHWRHRRNNRYHKTGNKRLFIPTTKNDLLVFELMVHCFCFLVPRHCARESIFCEPYSFELLGCLFFVGGQNFFVSTYSYFCYFVGFLFLYATYYFTLPVVAPQDTIVPKQYKMATFCTQQ